MQSEAGEFSGLAMAEERPPARDEARPWTRIDEYVVGLARRRTARRAQSPPPRTQPEDPSFSLSTLPFLLLMGALIVIAAAVIFAALPGSAPRPEPTPKPAEKGVAERGWLEDAEREFRR